MPAPGDLIHQQSTSTGTGNITLSSVNGKRTFNDEFGTGGTNKFDYFISNQAAAEWERGTGHLSASTTLVRDTVLASSNANAAVNFSAGTKDIANDVPAALQVRGPGSATVGNIALWDSSAGNLLKDAGYAPRAVLTSNRTYYVRSDGNDANTGLANTSGGAFATLQKALDVVGALDISIYNVTIQIGNTGTYVGGSLKPPVGMGTVTINGDAANKAAYVLTKSGSTILSAQSGGSFAISGVRLSDAAATYGVVAGDGTRVTLTNIDYGDVAGNMMMVQYGARVTLTGTGNVMNAAVPCTRFFYALNGGNIIGASGTKFTWLANSSASSAFVQSEILSNVSFFSTTFDLGAFSATGKRYSVSVNAIISGTGGGANYFPGSTAGSVATGGQYV